MAPQRAFSWTSCLMAATLLGAGVLSLTGCQQNAPPGAAQVPLGTETASTNPARPGTQSAGTSELLPVVAFQEDVEAGLAHAHASGKPVLLLFTARWCPHSQSMLQQAFRSLQVVRLSEQFICLHVEAGREPNAFREFRVSNYPTVQVLSSEGTPLSRIVGEQSAAELTSLLQDSLELEQLQQARLKSSTTR